MLKPIRTTDFEVQPLRVYRRVLILYCVEKLSAVPAQLAIAILCSLHHKLKTVILTHDATLFCDAFLFVENVFPFYNLLVFTLLLNNEIASKHRQLLA